MSSCTRPGSASRADSPADRAAPWLTVITPSFQQGDFIARTLASVASQGVKGVRHWVIDGGSTDDTVSILERHRNVHAGWFDFLSEPDDGQADALNKGLARVKTPVVGWLNADDVYAPGALATVAATFFGDDSPAWLYGRAQYIDANDRFLYPYPVASTFDPQALARVCFLCQPAVFWRPGAFDPPPRLDASLDTALDYDLWIRLARQHEPRFVDALLAESRLHPDIKTLRDRRAVYREIVGVVRRHYGFVPLSWAMGRAHGLCQADDDPLRPGRVHWRTIGLAACLCAWQNRRSLRYWPEAGRALTGFVRAGRHP